MIHDENRKMKNSDDKPMSNDLRLALGALWGPRKKVKQVTGNPAKLKKLAELKKVNQQIDKEKKTDEKRFNKMDKLFTKSRKLKEQLGID